MRTYTACTLDCSDACSLIVDTSKSGKVVIRGNPDHPITQGFTCAKIHRYPDILRRDDRITQPMLQMDGGWQVISWSEALGICADKIQALRGEPERILHVQSGGHKGICGQAPKLFFNLLGASSTHGGLCEAAGEAANLLDFGSSDMNDYRDLLNTKRIVNWGRDLNRGGVHQEAIIKKARKNGGRMLTISPGGDVCRDISDEAIRINLGCDRFLAAAAACLLLERGRVNPQAAGRSANWPEFAALIQESSLDELAQAAGVSRSEVELLADWYGCGEPVASLVGWGLQRYDFGCENVRFINALIMLSGNIGVSGGGSYFGLDSIRNFNKSWLTPNPWPRTISNPCLGREILKADPPIEFMWINYSNPVNQAPHSHKNAEALAQVPFVVAVDGFMHDTAMRADLVLPCALNLEHEELVGAFSHNFVNYARPIWNPPGESMPDLEIVRELGKLLDPPVETPEIEEFMRTSLDSPYLDISLEELREKGFGQAKRPWLAFEDLKFAHEDGLYHLPTTLSPEPPAPDGYPLRLLSLIRKEALHSQITPEEHQSPPLVWLAEDSPAWLGIDTAKPVYLASPLGRLQVAPRTMEGLHPLSVVYRRDDWMALGGGINQIISDYVTDQGDGAAYYAQYVRLEN
jgi:anaerobic selenocysteine-containing dehydrogenase